jgi:hypothetical protein
MEILGYFAFAILFFFLILAIRTRPADPKRNFRPAQPLTCIGGFPMRKTLLTAALLLTATTAAADIDIEKAVAASVPRGGVKRVIIDIPAGEIEVRNGAADRISLTGTIKRERGNDRDDEMSDAALKDINVEIYVRGNEAVVRRVFGKNADRWRMRTFTGFDVKINVPAGMAVQFETKYGEVSLDGRFGDVDVDLRAGEIDLRTPRADVGELNASCRVGEVRTDLGDRWVKREGVFPGKTHFLNSGGKSIVNLHVTAGEVDVTLTH